MQMGGWRAYWQKKNHTPKKLCSELYCLDSFAVFSEKVTMITDHVSRVYALLKEDGFRGTFAGVPIFLEVSKQKCNFGGFMHFFHCASCSARMRKVYFSSGSFKCRKCLNLGYRSQRLIASDRFIETKLKIINSLIAKHGSQEKRPPRMWRKTYDKKLRRIDLLYWRSSRAHYFENKKHMPEFSRFFG